MFPGDGHPSPLLFVLFVDSINNFIQHAKILLFADDIKMRLEINSLDDSRTLQSELVLFRERADRLG